MPTETPTPEPAESANLVGTPMLLESRLGQGIDLEVELIADNDGQEDLVAIDAMTAEHRPRSYVAQRRQQLLEMRKHAMASCVRSARRVAPTP